MVEKLVQHRSRQTIMESDLNNAQLYARASIDHVVGDGIEEGRRFVGFDVTQKGSLQVLVSAGRLYFDGGVYPPPSAFETWFVSAALDDDAFERIEAALPAAAEAAKTAPRPES